MKDRLWGLMLLVVITIGGVCVAAEITYVGAEMNIEDATNTPTAGWRNTDPAKPLDIDGDHILGTDGWFLDKSKSNPTYATITSVSPNKNGPYNGAVGDDPSDPSGADTLAYNVFFHDNNVNSINVMTSPLLQFVIGDNTQEQRILRVGVLCDGLLSAGTPNTATYTLTQTVGGSATATSEVLPWTGESMDAVLFDVTGAKTGDTFVVTVMSISIPTYPGGFEQVFGIVFDSTDGPPQGTVIVVR